MANAEGLKGTSEMGKKNKQKKKSLYVQKEDGRKTGQDRGEER